MNGRSKDSVSLRGYGQRDPLQVKKEAFNLFERLMGRIEEETTQLLIQMPAPEKVHVPTAEERANRRHPGKHQDGTPSS